MAMNELRNGKYINPAREGAKVLDLSTRPLVTGHAEELPVKRYILLDQTAVPETVLYQAIHHVDGLTAPPPDYQVFHSHEFVETYLFLGRGPEYTGLKAELYLEDERYEVVSPASVYIPVGMRHKYKMIEGSGLLVITALKSVYTYTKE
jgi:2-isopropylmalate synthase